MGKDFDIDGLLNEIQSSKPTDTKSKADRDKLLEDILAGKPLKKATPVSPPDTTPVGKAEPKVQTQSTNTPQERKPEPIQQKQATPPQEKKPEPTQQKQATPPQEKKPEPTQQKQATPPQEKKPEPTQQKQATPPQEKKPDPIQQKQATPPQEKKPEPIQQKRQDTPQEKKPEPIQQKRQDTPQEKKPEPIQQKRQDTPQEKKPEPIQQKQATPPQEKKPEPIQQKQATPPQERKPEPIQQKQSTPPQERKPEPIQQKQATPPQEKKPEPIQQKQATPPQERKPEPIQQKQSTPPQERKPEPIQQKQANPPHEKKPEPIQQKQATPPQERKPEPIQQKQANPPQEKKPEPIQQKQATPPQERKPEPIQQKQENTPQEKKSNGRRKSDKRTRGAKKSDSSTDKPLPIVSFGVENNSSDSIMDLLENALDEDVHDLEYIAQRQEHRSKPDKSAQKAATRKQLRYFFIGLTFTIMALVGTIVTISKLCGFAKGISDNMAQKAEFEQFIYPVVVTDPAAFDTIHTPSADIIIKAAIWDIIMYDDISKYEKIESTMIVPYVYVENHAKKLFGNISFVHSTTVFSSELTFYYDAESKSYSVPIAPQIFPSTPVVEDITSVGDQYTLTVAYQEPTPTWALYDENFTPDIQKYMTYVLAKSNDSFTVISVSAATDNAITD